MQQSQIILKLFCTCRRMTFAIQSWASFSQGVSSIYRGKKPKEALNGQLQCLGAISMAACKKKCIIIHHDSSKKTESKDLSKGRQKQQEHTFSSHIYSAMLSDSKVLWASHHETQIFQDFYFKQSKKMDIFCPAFMRKIKTSISWLVQPLRENNSISNITKIPESIHHYKVNILPTTNAVTVKKKNANIFFMKSDSPPPKPPLHGPKIYLKCWRKRFYAELGCAFSATHLPNYSTLPSPLSHHIKWTTTPYLYIKHFETLYLYTV